MTEFEVLVIPLSLILGLGVTRVLSGFIHAVRSRGQVAMHWVPIVWGLSILMYNVGYFNVLYDLDQSTEAWTWYWYGPVLLQTILLFLSAGLVFPARSDPGVEGMLDDFAQHGRLALIPLGSLLVLAPLTNVLQGGLWLHIDNALNLLLVGLIVASFDIRRRSAAVATSAFGLLTAVGWLFLWAQPGD